MKDTLKQYAALKHSLIAEKASIEARLRQINEVIGEEAVPKSTPTSKPQKASRKRAKNKLSLKAAVMQVTQGKALAKAEILAAIQKLGYRFSTKDPMNSLNTVLYTGKQFKNTDGKFTVAR